MRPDQGGARDETKRSIATGSVYYALRHMTASPDKQRWSNGALEPEKRSTSLLILSRQSNKQHRVVT